MSHGAVKKLPIQRVAQATALAVVFAVMFFASRAVAVGEGISVLIAGVGFLLLSGMLASELLETS